MNLPLAAKKIDRESKEVRAEVLGHLKKEFWRRGNLRYLTLPHAQRRMYDRAHRQRELYPGVAEPLVFVVHRQLGKSHLDILLLLEECIRNPGCVTNFCMDTIENAREIFEDRFSGILTDAPPWLSFRTRKNTVYIRCRHWPSNVESKIRLRGIDYRRGDGLRGGNTSMVVIDEVRNVSHLKYVMARVVTPMFRGQKAPLLIMTTTPPDSMDHDFLSYYHRAKRSGALMEVPASKNPDWTEDDERLMLAEYGSKQDIGWRREIEVEMISDTSRLVLPEWGASDGAYVVEEIPRPTHYRGYVTIDSGWKDHTGVLLALYDFENRRIGVLDELFVNYVPTGELAELLVEKIEQTFPPEFRRGLRINADSNALNLADLNVALRKYGYRVHPVRKYDREASINNLRSGISQGRVVVQENCEELNQQLKNVIWNARRTDFERSKERGHYDLVDSLIYKFRSIYWEENPFPNLRPRWSSTTGFPIPTPERSKKEEAIRAIFGKKPKPPGRM